MTVGFSLLFPYVRRCLQNTAMLSTRFLPTLPILKYRELVGNSFAARIIELLEVVQINSLRAWAFRIRCYALCYRAFSRRWKQGLTAEGWAQGRR